MTYKTIPAATKAATKRHAWGLLWRQENKADGVKEHLLGTWPAIVTAPNPFQGCGIALFKTRSAAREWANAHYGYIRTREDLRREPHGWKVPIPVKVEIQVRRLE